MLSRDMPGICRADSSEWAVLFDLLSPLDAAPPAKRRMLFQRCLKSLARRAARLSDPQRVSFPQTRATLEVFLAESSGGLRTIAIATALMKVIGQGFQLFARVESHFLFAAPSIKRSKKLAGAAAWICQSAAGRVLYGVMFKG